jgi:hypothetical protein
MGVRAPFCLHDNASSGNSSIAALIPAGERTAWTMLKRGKYRMELKPRIQFTSNNLKLHDKALACCKD